MLEHDRDEPSHNPDAMQSPSQEDKAGGFTTPRSVKTMKRLKKLQDAPSFTNSLDFTGTNDCTPKRQRKCKGRDCTPELSERETPEPSSFALQSSFTTLLNQSDSMKKSCFQLLNQASESSAREALHKLDLTSESYGGYSSARPGETGAISFPYGTKYKEDQRDRNYQIASMLVRLYFFTFNQRSETLAKVFIPECPFEIIGEEPHTFQYTIQCLSQAIKSFDLDEATLEFLYIDETTPWVITGSGKAVTMDGSTLGFTQSFKVLPKGKGLFPGKVVDVGGVIENYTVVHTKLMISAQQGQLITFSHYSLFIIKSVLLFAIHSAIKLNLNQNSEPRLKMSQENPAAEELSDKTVKKQKSSKKRLTHKSRHLIAERDIEETKVTEAVVEEEYLRDQPLKFSKRKKYNLQYKAIPLGIPKSYTFLQKNWRNRIQNAKCQVQTLVQRLKQYLIKRKLAAKFLQRLRKMLKRPDLQKFLQKKLKPAKIAQASCRLASGPTKQKGGQSVNGKIFVTMILQRKCRPRRNHQ
eukprot:TRINITY_DN1988_c0_g1_i1.p1 TRINITY_DN1988_c0_g1~~TRINITY_DN1988_c0_g1_i1.p1  ORF type:complete len:525 (-),score=25.61 TRINITY_DN1988_c0_g1_i1:1247-2821(-)